jgi:hypothetical protein
VTAPSDPAKAQAKATVEVPARLDLFGISPKVTPSTVIPPTSQIKVLIKASPAKSRATSEAGNSNSSKKSSAAKKVLAPKKPRASKQPARVKIGDTPPPTSSAPVGRVRTVSEAHAETLRLETEKRIREEKDIADLTAEDLVAMAAQKELDDQAEADQALLDAIETTDGADTPMNEEELLAPPMDF